MSIQKVFRMYMIITKIRSTLRSKLVFSEIYIYRVSCHNSIKFCNNVWGKLVVLWKAMKLITLDLFLVSNWTASSEFVSALIMSIPSWQIVTAHAQPFNGAGDLAFCLRVPLDSLLVWASSGGSGETARMRRLAWTFAARIGDKYQIRLTRPNYPCPHELPGVHMGLEVLYSWMSGLHVSFIKVSQTSGIKNHKVHFLNENFKVECIHACTETALHWKIFLSKFNSVPCCPKYKLVFRINKAYINFTFATMSNDCSFVPVHA